MLQENMRTFLPEDVLLHMLVCVLTLSDELKAVGHKEARQSKEETFAFE